jgi:hypothetical protein
MIGEHPNTRFSGIGFHGLWQTANVKSSTKTEVLNVSGPGVIQFLGAAADDNDTVSSADFQVDIDGVTVLDRVGYSANENTMVCAVGAILAGGATGADDQIITFEAIPFYSNLTVKLAGDDTDWMSCWYSYYLT